MPGWPESDEIWGTYSQKTVKIAGKMHGEFSVIFKLFFCHNSINFSPIWTNFAFFQHNICCPRFSILWIFLKKQNFDFFFPKKTLNFSLQRAWFLHEILGWGQLILKICAMSFVNWPLLNFFWDPLWRITCLLRKT